MMYNSVQWCVCSRQWRNEASPLAFYKQPHYVEIRMQELDLGLTSDLREKGSSIKSVARRKALIGWDWQMDNEAFESHWGGGKAAAVKKWEHRETTYSDEIGQWVASPCSVVRRLLCGQLWPNMANWERTRVGHWFHCQAGKELT